jgi:hypothetical protein
MGGQELLSDIRSNRMRAISPNLSPTEATDEAKISDKGLLVAFLTHARLDRPMYLGKPMPSTHGPYVRTLPDSFHLPLAWDEADLQRLASCILGHKTLRLVAAQTAVLVRDFCTFRREKKICELLGLFPDGMDEKFSREKAFDTMIWACSAITSRVFGGMEAMTGTKAGAGDRPGFGVMVPLFDLFNHDPISAQITFSPPYGVIHKDVPRGEQIVSHYGAEQSNADLLVCHGFAQWNGPHDSLVVGWSLPGVAKAPQESAALLAAILSSVCSGGDEAQKKIFSRVLMQGGVVENVLTHAKPLGEYLVKIGNAVASSSLVERSNESVEKKAQAYLYSYLHGKREKLLKHLEGNYENRPWEETVKKARGIQNNCAVFGSTSYATTIQSSTIAFYDSVLSILEHSIEVVEDSRWYQ